MTTRSYVRLVKSLIAVGVALGCAVTPAGATVIDLTSAGTIGSVNDALFYQIDPQSTGTGTIHSFVRMQSPGNETQEHAYNTTVNNVLNNTSDDTHNYAVVLGDIPTVTISGIAYRQFLLDIAEPDANRQNQDLPLVSLDEIQIFLSTIPNQSVTTFNGSGVLGLNGSLIYRLDANEDSHILLNASLNSGNGSGDMFAYIPNSLFTGPSNQYVYLYSHFGEQEDATGSFEEWAHLTNTQVVPEPATMTLMTLGLAALGLTQRKWKKA